MSLNLKPSVSTLLRISGHLRFQVAVDEDVALRRGDEVGGEIFAADVIEIAGDAEGRKRPGPRGRILRREATNGCKQEEQRDAAGERTHFH